MVVILAANFVNSASKSSLTNKLTFENLKHRGDLKLVKPQLTLSQLLRG